MVEAETFFSLSLSLLKKGESGRSLNFMHVK